MKIIHISPGLFDKGGIARYNRFQVSALRQGFGPDQVQVFSLAGRRHDDLEEPFAVDYAGPVPMNSASRPLMAAEAMRAVRSFRPDAVLCAHVNMGPLCLALARASGARLAQNIYGREIWIKGGLGRARAMALRRADLVIADCHNTADRSLEMGLVRRRPEVIWDCVDTVRYTPGEPDWDALAAYGLSRSERFRLLFLGRINRHTRYKGFERLLHLTARLPGSRFEAVIAGKGDDAEHVLDLAARLGVADRTVLTGPVDEAHMPDIYRAADAFYLASEVGPSMGEGIPLTPLEAMSCGAPVLVGDQDGSREAVEGAGGWCGDPTDLETQAAYLTDLAGDAARHQAEGAAARARALDCFSFDGFAAKTSACLTALLRRSP